jgi:hypothetical protein
MDAQNAPKTWSECGLGWQCIVVVRALAVLC